MGRKFDAAALAIVATGLKEIEDPLEIREFRLALDRVISSIYDLTKSQDEFTRVHASPTDPLWTVAGKLAGKSIARSADQTFMELRQLCNRLRRIRIGKHSEDDIPTIVAIAEFICAGDLFVEAV